MDITLPDPSSSLGSTQSTTRTHQPTVESCRDWIHSLITSVDTKSRAANSLEETIQSIEPVFEPFVDVDQYRGIESLVNRIIPILKQSHEVCFWIDGRAPPGSCRNLLTRVVPIVDDGRRAKAEADVRAEFGVIEKVGVLAQPKSPDMNPYRQAVIADLEIRVIQNPSTPEDKLAFQRLRHQQAFFGGLSDAVYRDALITRGPRGGLDFDKDFPGFLVHVVCEAFAKRMQGLWASHTSCRFPKEVCRPSETYEAVGHLTGTAYDQSRSACFNVVSSACMMQ